VKCLSSVNSTVIPKHRKVGNIREIFLRAALKVTAIFRKHDVTLKHEVPSVLCFRTTKLDNQWVLIYYDFSVCKVTQFCVKKIRATLCHAYVGREGR